MKTLFELLCAFPLLHQAWLIVLQKKSIGGIDNINLYEYSRNVDKRLAALSEALRQRSWKPQPYLGVTIPKNKLENRELGLLSIEDKVVQQALKILIEPRLEKRFYSCSYAYRPGRGHLRAIKRTLHECKQTKNQWYLKLDIDNFFDTIDHNILFSRLKVAISDLEICRLVELCMTMGHVNLSMEWKKREKGIPQGAILSPLLANLYLTSFDQFVLSCTTSYIRYADDFVVWCETQDVAKSLHEKITKYLNVRLNLGLNPPVVGSVADGIEFLGVIVRNCSISISEDKQHKLCEQIRQIEIVDSKLSKRYLESLAGIHRYYATILPEKYVLSFTSALRMAISDWITSNSQYSKKNCLQFFRMFHSLVLRRRKINRSYQMSYNLEYQDARCLQ